MRITAIDTYILEARLEQSFGWSQGWVNRRHAGLVKISTDAGLVGWGEGLSPAAAAIVKNRFSPLLLGQNPNQRNQLWQQMFSTLYNANEAGGAGGSAISAIDIALWDLSGKAANLPVSALLGGTIRDKVAVYATGLYYTRDELPHQLPAEAESYVAAGFKGMKTKVGGLPLPEDVARVKLLREVIGPDIALMIDANQGYNAATAIRLGRALEDVDLTWFEEPVNAAAPEGYARVRAGLDIPLAGGENLRTRYAFAPFLNQRAYDIVQPDVVNVGGLTEMQAVCHTAHSFGLLVCPHVWGTPIMIAASLHLAATLPPCPPARDPQPYAQEPVMEFDRTPNPLREELSPTPFAAEDGFVAVPTEPGLGVTIDEAVLERYRIA